MCVLILTAVGATGKKVSYNVDLKLNPRYCGKELDKWAIKYALILINQESDM
jgi:hypothetical protein